MSLIRVSVFKPKKSIFSSPALSTTELSYWVTYKSESLAVAIGTKLVMSSGVIIIPQAWVPTFLRLPSKILAWFMVSAWRSSPDERDLSSNTFAKSSDLKSSFNFFSSFSKISFNFKLGISLAILSASPNDKSNTLAVSLIEDLAAILPYVIIWATWLAPYFSITYSITLPLPSSSKSISISGILTLSGFKNLSKSKSYFIGSILVIPKQ